MADLHPKLRSTVQISRQHFRGQQWHVVQDHTNNAFFRLAGPAYRFIGLLDGKRSVGEAWNLANEQLGDDAPTQGEVIQLLGQLYTSNLLQAEVPADTHALFARYKQRKQREITSYLMNIMFSRIPIWDPDHFLNKILPLVSWIFSPVGLVVWLVLIGSGIYSLMGVHDWTSKVASQRSGLLSPDNLVLLYVAFSLIKACHEMGHAISCKKFGKQSGTGGEVHVIGIMFLVFTPVPYVDASSSWALTNKWHRAIVGAAGMWVELAIASVAAIVWSNTRDGAMLHNFAYNIMFVAGFSTIVFNANPLLRYDGYYILSDLLEIPNLSTRGTEYIYYLVKKYVWNVRFARNPAHGPSEKFWLFVYAITSFVMRMFVTLSIMFYLTGVLNGTLIILAAGMAIAGMITWAVVPTGKFIHFLATNGELSRTRARAIGTSAFAAILVVGVLCFVPVPDHARAQGVVEPTHDGMRELITMGSGEVTELNAEPHDSHAPDRMLDGIGMPNVNAGTQIMVGDNPQIRYGLARDQGQLEVYELTLQKAFAEVSSTQPSEVPMNQANIRVQEKSIADDREKLALQTVTAPISGVLVAPELKEKQGMYVKQNERLGEIIDLHNLIIRTAVANDLSGMLIKEIEKNPLVGQHVEIRIDGRPDVLFSGDILEMAPAGSDQLPSPALGYQVGGLITTAADDQHGVKTEEKFFEVRLGHLKLESAPQDIKDLYANPADLPLLPGQRVVVRFTLSPKPLAMQAWTKFRQVFQKKFNQ